MRQAFTIDQQPINRRANLSGGYRPGARFSSIALLDVSGESCGTKPAGTAAGTAKVIVLGALLPMLKPSLGLIDSAAVTGAIVLLAAVLGLFRLKETSGRDLDFVE